MTLVEAARAARDAGMSYGKWRATQPREGGQEDKAKMPLPIDSRECKDCGASILDRKSQSKRCAPCQREYNKKCAREIMRRIRAYEQD